MGACVRACVRARVRAFVRVCVCENCTCAVCVGVWTHTHLHIFLHARMHACKTMHMHTLSLTTHASSLTRNWEDASAHGDTRASDRCPSGEARPHAFVYLFHIHSRK